MAVPARPVAGAVVESAWGQIAHDAAVAMDIQSGQFQTTHTAINVSPQVAVVFPRPFAAGSSPVVIVSSDNFNYSIGLNGNRATPTGFSAATKRVDGSAPTSGVPCEWIAYGPRA